MEICSHYIRHLEETGAKKNRGVQKKGDIAQFFVAPILLTSTCYTWASMVDNFLTHQMFVLAPQKKKTELTMALMLYCCEPWVTAVSSCKQA